MPPPIPRAVADENDTALCETAELAGAFAPSKERRLETTVPGRAFVATTRAAWPRAAFRADIVGMRHETPYARRFRS